MQVWKIIDWWSGADSLWRAGRTKERAEGPRGAFLTPWEFLLCILVCCFYNPASWWHEGDPVFNLLPVMTNEDVLPVSGSDGHYLVRVAFKHLLYRLHFFMVTYANFYIGIYINFNGPSPMIVFVIGKIKAFPPIPWQNEKPLFPRVRGGEKLRRWWFNKVILFADFIFIRICK